MTLEDQSCTVTKITENLIMQCNPKLLQQLQEMKNLMKDDRSLDNFIEFFDDVMLLAFIKGKKFDVILAHKTLVNYINARHKYPNVFKTLLPSTTACLNVGVLRTLKNRDKDRLILVNRTWKWDTNEVDADDTHKMFSLLMDEYLQIIGSHNDIEGVVAIFDYRGFTFNHFKVATPNKVFQLVDLLWRNVPIRYKALHLVNASFLVNCVLKFTIPFLPKTARERLRVHSSMDSLYEHIPQNILPESLGGPIPEDEAFDDGIEMRIKNKEEYYAKFSEKL